MAPSVKRKSSSSFSKVTFEAEYTADGSAPSIFERPSRRATSPSFPRKTAGGQCPALM